MVIWLVVRHRRHIAEGDTIDEAIFNCVNVIKMVAAYRAERGESIGVDEVFLTPDVRISVAMPVEVG